MVLMVALFVLPEFSSVEAQWVMAAHAVKIRIQQMTQKSGTGGFNITKNDATNGRIEIEQGQQVAGFHITALGDKLTQLVIASSVSDKTQPSPTSMVVESVLRVCKEVDAKCSVEQH
jgi:hypothetical protein